MNEWLIKFGMGWIFVGLVTTGGMEALGYNTSGWDILIWPRFMAYEVVLFAKEAHEEALKKQEAYQKAVYRYYYYKKDPYYGRQQ